MNRQEIMQKLEEIFRDVFDDDDIVLTETMSAADIEDWDSLRQISILAATENVFHIKLAISDTRKMKNVGELVSTVEQKLQ